MMFTLTAIFWTVGVKVPWHFRFWEWKYHVIFASGCECSRKHKFHLWNLNTPRSESMCERKFQLPHLPHTHA